MHLIESRSIKDAWNEAYDLILKSGNPIKDNNDKLLEILDLFLIISNPEPSNQENEIIDEKWKEWMLSNFQEIKIIPELNDTKSYGWRLYDNHGRDQIKWVINKLKNNPSTKSATISLILPDDEKYIPCVSLIDFKMRFSKLLVSVTCRSLDFGKKALYNLYALSDIAHNVAKEIGCTNISLKALVHSAHIYEHDIV